MLLLLFYSDWFHAAQTGLKLASCTVNCDLELLIPLPPLSSARTTEASPIPFRDSVLRRTGRKLRSHSELQINTGAPTKLPRTSHNHQIHQNTTGRHCGSPSKGKRRNALNKVEEHTYIHTCAMFFMINSAHEQTWKAAKGENHKGTLASMLKILPTPLWPHHPDCASSQKLSRAGPRQFLDGDSPQNSSLQLLRRMLSIRCSWQPHGRCSK